jgi:hypothetical protein
MYNYIANWFRTLVSVFAENCEREIRKMVILRVSHLVEVHNRIDQLLGLVHMDMKKLQMKMKEQNTYILPVLEGKSMGEMFQE